MTQEELKEFLKEHLRIELFNHYECYRTYLGVRITLDGEEIDSSVNYDIELWHKNKKICYCRYQIN